MPLVVLVGAPGSGKSTVGRLLAETLGATFRDTDDDIAATAGMNVHDIFVLHGEAYFRDLEQAAVLTALAEHLGVLALGGGAVLSPAVRGALIGAPVAWLRVDATTAVSRVGLSGPRPVLLGNVRAQWAALLAARSPLYDEVAQWRIDTVDRSADQIVEEIMEALRAADE